MLKFRINSGYWFIPQWIISHKKLCYLYPVNILSMRILISLCWVMALSLTTISVQGQADTLFNQTDINNLKQGYWKKTYPDGKLLYKGFFKDNKPVGEMRRYFESGALKAIFFYDKTGESARVRLFYEDGKIAAEGKYFNTLKDSTWKYHSYYSGQVTSTEEFARGLRNGMMVNYYDNGDVSEKLEWKNNKKCGLWEQYLKGNILKLKGTYSDGRLEGEFLVNYEDGKSYAKGQYLHDQRYGKWVFYSKDGSIQSELEYLNGKVVNEDKLNEEQQNMFRTIDENQGKFEEPDENNFLVPPGR
jgi:antitoxin component YwqK of YwqJK toxin-antitoxin module